MKIYAVSGLGADHRVFNELEINCELVHLAWIPHQSGESLQQYSKRLSEKVDQSNPFIILGVSFGGLVAVEISKILKPRLTILISSVETSSELKPAIRFFGKTDLASILPARMFDPPRSIAQFLFGARNPELLNSILDDTDLEFAKWAVIQLMSWSNTDRLENCLKIEGSKDKLMPPTYSNGSIQIESGEHFMIVDKSKEISEIINHELESISPQHGA